MIHVLVKRAEYGVALLHVEGHAQPPQKRGGGYDLICAAVSALMGNLIEGYAILEKSDQASVDEQTSAVHVIVEDDPAQQLLAEATIRSLSGIEKQYKKYLQIHTMEV